MAIDSEENFNAWYKNSSDNDDDIKMQCLVTGKYETIAKIHTPTKGVRNAQPAGARIVSFDENSCSYGKESSYNAPVSKLAMFKYTTMLNYMLSKPKYRLYAGDATVVFWAKKTGIYEDLMAELFNLSEDKADAVTSEKDTKTRNLAKAIIEKYSIGLNLRQEK